jgi:antimicrobial peptide system SdpB family protein
MSRQAIAWRVVGVARAMIAAAMMATLLATPLNEQFGGDGYDVARSGTVWQASKCHGVLKVSLFCLTNPRHFDAARLIAIVVLAIVVVGLYPAFTCIPHWYVAWSCNAWLATQDGGDQIASIVCLLLIPICLLDRRPSHWSRSDPRAVGWVARTVTTTFFFLISLQMAALYAHAALAKLGRPEWVDGTALYYWLNDPQFGAQHAPLVGGIVGHLSNPLLVTAITWGPIAIEASLALSLLQPRWRRVTVPAGISLHACIGLLMGLTSFSLTMIACLLLYRVAPSPALSAAPEPFKEGAGEPVRDNSPTATFDDQHDDRPSPATDIDAAPVPVMA